MAEGRTAWRGEVEEARQRRRLWAKITATRIYLAGPVRHPVGYRRGVEGWARQAGVEPDEVEGQDSDG